MNSRRITLLGIVLLSIAVIFFLGCDRTQTFTLTVTVEPEGAGEVEPDGGEFEENTSVTLEVTVEEGYYFLEWAGEHGDDVAEDEGEWKILMDEDKEITAVFSDMVPIDMSVEPAEMDIEVGESKELQVTVEPEDADLNFASSDETIAEVDEDGEITALALGTATITVTATKEDYHDAEEEVDVTVVQTLDQVGKPEWDDNDDKITWDDVDGALSYEVSLYLDNDLITSETVDPGVEKHDFSQEILTAGTGEYTVTVQAMGDGEYILHGKTSEPSLERVKHSLQVGRVGEGEVTITIDSEEYELGYGEERTLLFTKEQEVAIEASVLEGTDFREWQEDGQQLIEEESTTITMDENREIAAKIEHKDGFAGGTGTRGNPYQVRTAEQLDNVRNFLAACFDQIDHIHLSGYQENEGWEPIGDDVNPFAGSFYGKGYKIIGLCINDPNVSGKGLFGYGDNAEFQDILLVDVDIEGYDYVGGLIGYLKNGTVENVQVTGSVQGRRRVGGLIGNLDNGTVDSSQVTGSVEGSSSHVGGLIGELSDGSVENSSVAANVEGTDRVGGLIGRMNNNQVINCYATGDVDGTGDMGGLIGHLENGTVKNSYSTGKVEGEWNVGGLIGYDEASGIIESCHAEGEVIGESGVGGLIGWSDSDISDSYATGDVTGNEEVGGLVGGSRSFISNSYATGNVEGNNRVGGLIGDNRGVVEKSYATGNVQGKDDVGGFAGLNEDEITDCYATGNVQGNFRVGGLVGHNKEDVIRCYSTGKVTGTTDWGGLLGDNSLGFVQASYWDTETSETTESDGGEGRTTAQMQAGTPGDTLDEDGEEYEHGDLMYEDWCEEIWNFGGDYDYPILL